MQAPRWERFPAGGGVLFFVFAVAGMAIAQLGLPGPGATDAEIVEYFSHGDTELKRELGSTLVGFAVYFFLFFLGSLRSSLREVEGGRGTFGSVALIAGAVMAGLVLVSAALETAIVSANGFFNNYDVDAETALFGSLSFWIGGFSLLAGGVMVGATSIVALKIGLLPRWLAVAGLVLAVISFFGESAMAFVVPILLVMLWIAVVSALLFRRSGRTTPSTVIERGRRHRTPASTTPTSRA